MNKRLIEYDLPLADISEESAREKNIRHGHPSTLHIWWAQQPLASLRTTVLSPAELTRRFVPRWLDNDNNEEIRGNL
jgi:adenine-specific DNA methylase